MGIFNGIIRAGGCLIECAYCARDMISTKSAQFNCGRAIESVLYIIFRFKVIEIKQAVVGHDWRFWKTSNTSNPHGIREHYLKRLNYHIPHSPFHMHRHDDQQNDFDSQQRSDRLAEYLAVMKSDNISRNSSINQDIEYVESM